jgi:hypothetical protein
MLKEEITCCASVPKVMMPSLKTAASDFIALLWSDDLNASHLSRKTDSNGAGIKTEFKAERPESMYLG